MLLALVKFSWLGCEVLFSEEAKFSLGIIVPSDGISVRFPVSIVQRIRDETTSFFKRRPYRRCADLARPLWLAWQTMGSLAGVLHCCWPCTLYPSNCPHYSDKPGERWLPEPWPLELKKRDAWPRTSPPRCMLWPLTLCRCRGFLLLARVK